MTGESFKLLAGEVDLDSKLSCEEEEEQGLTAPLSALEDEVQETEMLLKLRGSCPPGPEQVRD